MSELVDTVAGALYLQIAIVFGGVWHMVAVKRNWLAPLCRPIAENLFGRNKTWRGLVIVPVLTAIGAVLLFPLEALWPHLGWQSPLNGHSLLLAGLCGGAGYVLAELPNSWFKRQLGIAPGETPDQHRWLFLTLDQVDSGIGAALAFMLYPGIDGLTALVYVLTFPAVALLVKRALFMAKLKSSPA